MASPPYTVCVDRPRLLIRATLHGLWQLGTLERFRREMERALAELATTGATPDRFRLLVDLRDHGVQPREVAQAIQAQLTHHASAGPHAILVSQSALHKMQVQRMGATLNAAYFADEAAALAWLLAAGPAAAD